MAKQSKRYRVLADGVNFPGERGELRREKDDIIDDLDDRVNERTIANWLTHGIIEEYTGRKAKSDDDEEG